MTMFGSSRKLLAVACFAAILIGLVNLAWWVFYDRTQQMLDRQLSRRLLATAKAAAAVLPADVIENLTLGDLDAFANVAGILEEIRAADSLAELFILNENYTYLATRVVPRAGFDTFIKIERPSPTRGLTYFST